MRGPPGRLRVVQRQHRQSAEGVRRHEQGLPEIPDADADSGARCNLLGWLRDWDDCPVVELHAMKDAKITPVNGSTIQFECPWCEWIVIRGKRYFDHLGPSIRCPKCIQICRVPISAMMRDSSGVESVVEGEQECRGPQ